ncbi:hypothetical protein CTI12_AA330460 [Artemisia annua]|uniref:Uncharacterized protein n=1 Tax=Artemisia annua TaxID=35608 RepID=A0A2U1MXT1_ARTAN|nr:hypothetical protein CTI12_AA330460 [Artemisia annua]
MELVDEITTNKAKTKVSSFVHRIADRDDEEDGDTDEDRDDEEEGDSDEQDEDGTDASEQATRNVAAEQATIAP